MKYRDTYRIVISGIVPPLPVSIDEDLSIEDDAFYISSLQRITK